MCKMISQSLKKIILIASATLLFACGGSGNDGNARVELRRLDGSHLGYMTIPAGSMLRGVQFGEGYEAGSNTKAAIWTTDASGAGHGESLVKDGMVLYPSSATSFVHEVNTPEGLTAIRKFQ